MENTETQIHLLKHNIVNLTKDIEKLGEQVIANGEVSLALKETINSVLTDISAFSVSASKVDNISKVVLEGNGEPALRTYIQLILKDLEIQEETLDNKISKDEFLNSNKEIRNSINELHKRVDKQEKSDKENRDRLYKLIYYVLGSLIVGGLFYMITVSIEALVNSNNNSTSKIIDSEYHLVANNEPNRMD